MKDPDLAHNNATQTQTPGHKALDPVDQLLYAAFHTRNALDRVDAAIAQRTDPTDPTGDTLFTTTFGRYLEETQYRLRSQLGLLAKQYISLGIEERQTRAFEAWSNVLLPILLNLMSDPDLHLTRRQKSSLPKVIERHLVGLESGASGTELDHMDRAESG